MTEVGKARSSDLLKARSRLEKRSEDVTASAAAADEDDDGGDGDEALLMSARGARCDGVDDGAAEPTQNLNSPTRHARLRILVVLDRPWDACPFAGPTRTVAGTAADAPAPLSTSRVLPLQGPVAREYYAVPSSQPCRRRTTRRASRTRSCLRLRLVSLRRPPSRSSALCLFVPLCHTRSSLPALIHLT